MSNAKLLFGPMHSHVFKRGSRSLKNYKKYGNESTVCAKLSAVAVQIDLLRLKLYHKQHETIEQNLNHLWDLLDESEPCCQRLVLLGGADLLVSCFHIFGSDVCILKTMLGVYGNLSERHDLHQYTLTGQAMNMLVCVIHKMSMAQEQLPERACCILSHFLSNGAATWPWDCLPLEDISRPVVDICNEFGENEKLHVVYTSFRPVLALLSQEVSEAAKYWAVWTLNRCTVQEPKRYCPILAQEDAVSVLQQQDNSSEYVSEMSREIIGRIQAPRGIQKFTNLFK